MTTNSRLRAPFLLAGVLLALSAMLGCSQSPREGTPRSDGVAEGEKTRLGPEHARVTPPTLEGPTLEAGNPPAGDLHIAVPAGTVVRSGPEPSAEAIALISEAGLVEVREQTGEAYRIELVIEDASHSEAVEGWVRRSKELFKEVRIHRGRRLPQPAPDPDPALLATAQIHLGAGRRELDCGPYRLLTDVAGETLPTACGRLATGLDAFYEESFGVRPVGEPRGAVILFRSLDTFRAFAGEATGHAGHAHASEGYIALYLGERSHAELITTLAHELAHLVHRRALGSPLPRWLSEGLADAIGDPATLEGLGPVTGLEGAEVARRRVLERPDLPDVEALSERGPGEFDAGPRARDYEESAVLVRYLLSDPTRRQAFRDFLRGVAAGESADLATLIHHLDWPPGEGPAQLDRGLRRWLAESR